MCAEPIVEPLTSRRWGVGAWPGGTRSGPEGRLCKRERAYLVQRARGSLAFRLSRCSAQAQSPQGTMRLDVLPLWAGLSFATPYWAGRRRPYGQPCDRGAVAGKQAQTKT